MDYVAAAPTVCPCAGAGSLPVDGYRGLGYHRPPLLRFVLLALLLTILLIGIGSLVADFADGGRFGPRLEGRFVLGGWLLQAVGLVALFLLIQGRGGAWWVDGLLAGWLAWIFRGPVLVLALAENARASAASGWSIAARWLLIYTVCGLVLGLMARRMRVRR